MENRRTSLAFKKLYAAVKKVNKTCSDIVKWISVVEEQLKLLESEMGSIMAQHGSQKSQKTDVMWKAEEFENWQQRNNLHFLRTAEGAEGNNIRSFMLTLLKGAFPELTQWDWDSELQWVHLFPITIKKQQVTNVEKPRAILVNFGNFLLRKLYFRKHLPMPEESLMVILFCLSCFLSLYVERCW
ncbi:hypothetical protein NDU88_001965 [Pleurodeles waltl]|uniref:Uncharacterized protein n=1 Tax=Pleurodeles waltl TaxID=8319 RepID=A0AAV7W126_PLEWA|nr:hypothetical protein NDU88_001965 [Pleurodeles waltl]